MDDLKLIKKHYSEKMSHLCRELFPTILEKPGVLYELMIKNFEPSKFLYDDIIKRHATESFKDLMYSQINMPEEEKVNISKTPAELLDEAGYILYECKTERDIQSFKKFYAKGEELCTFRGRRLERCHVFFAVKKNVDEIKRKDFKNPDRQDEYGTSVISIQFTKDKTNHLSIKNRYNHTVINPDATFSNDLDNIIPGLTEAFNRTYKLDSKRSNTRIRFELPKYVKANDGKCYKYKLEANNIYYCYDNVVIDNFEVKRFDKSRYIIFDSYVLDLQKKEIYSYDSKAEDDFPNTIKNITKIEQNLDRETGIRTIRINDNIVIEIDEFNQMISYSNPNVEKINDNFLYENKTLVRLSLPNVTEIGWFCLPNNQVLGEIDMPKLKRTNHAFMCNNQALKVLDFPELMVAGSEFMIHNKSIKKIILPKLESADYKFLQYNENVRVLFLPRLRRLDYTFLRYDKKLFFADLPNVKIMYSDPDGYLSHTQAVSYAPQCGSIKPPVLSKVKRIISKVIY